MRAKRSVWQIAAFLWLLMGIYGLIFRESAGSTPPPFPHFDKMAHFFLFFVQTWLWAKNWLVVRQMPPLRLLAVCGLIYAVSSELAQHFFTATRQADLWDMVADMLGVSLALYWAHVVGSLHNNKKKS